MKDLELFIERIILASRWILVVFYLVLAAALAIYALAVIKKFALIAYKILAMEEADVIISMLNLIDAALVAGLIVMVMISGYENFVSRFDDDTELTWLGKIGASSLKVKIASAIVAISSIHLLQVFLNATNYSNDKIMWSTLVHLTFVVSAFALALLDRVQSGALTTKTLGEGSKKAAAVSSDAH